jgi:nucleoside-diphosphate-sugar epimerase
LPFTILRPSQLYGNDSSLKKHQPFFYTIIDKAEKNEDIAIYGSRDALRNYLHIEDFAKIISLVVKNKIEGLYNCTNKFDLSLLDLANLAIKVFHSTGQVFFLKDKQNIKDNIFPYEDILYTKINYSPQITIEEGIRKIADFRLSKK